jgi:hypothetical protein
MRVVRHRPQREVTLGGVEVPLIDPKAPDSQQVQQHLIPEARVFDLSDPEDLEEYRAVWADITVGRSLSSEHAVNFCPEKATYIAFMRWSDVEYSLPGGPIQARRRKPKAVKPPFLPVA